MRFGWAIGFLASQLAWGIDCPRLLSTSFGLTGPLIATLGEEGQITLLNDGFSLAFGDEPTPLGGNVVPHFSSTPLELTLSGSLDEARALTSLTDTDSERGFFSLVSQGGDVELALPDGRVFSIILPSEIKTTSVSFFRTPLRDLESQLMPVDGIRAPKDTKSFHPTQDVKGNTQDIERNTPISLFVSTPDKVLRFKIQITRTDALDEDLKEGLVLGDLHVELENDGSVKNFKVEGLPLLDFSAPHTNHHYLIPTLNEDFAIKISAPTTVFSLSKHNTKLSRIDFIEAVAWNRVVLASEMGQVAIVDLAKREIERDISFPDVAWVHSLSAQYVGGFMQIWAVSGKQKKLYKWSSLAESTHFSRVENFPTGVHPQYVASFASRLSLRHPSKEQAKRGFYTNLIPSQFGLIADAVYVLGNDGQLYSERDVIPKIGELDAGRRWVSFPFE